MSKRKQPMVSELRGGKAKVVEADCPDNEVRLEEVLGLVGGPDLDPEAFTTDDDAAAEALASALEGDDLCVDDDGGVAEAQGAWLAEVAQADAGAELPIDADTLQTATELDLSKLSISAAQARLMAPIICSNSVLTSISFAGHDLSISDLREEDELDWDSEEFTDVVAILIAEYLKTNDSIKRLDLARNQISDDGCAALALAMGLNQTVEYLNLESNMITERGGLQMSRALLANSTLTYLNLSQNAIPASIQQEVRDVWTRAREGSQLGLHL